MPPSRREILQQIYSHAAAICQNVDEVCLQKLAELTDQEVTALHSLVQDKIVNASSPVRNISAVLLSIVRTISGSSSHGSSRWEPRGRTSSGGGGGNRGARALLEEYGIYGVDEMAVNKMEEMSADDQRCLIQDFQAVNESETITSPSKWLFAKARTHLVQQRHAGTTGREPCDEYEIPELPGIHVDGKCHEKMQELEPEERNNVLSLFQEESDHQEIRNPSGWLYAKSRSAIVARVTGGTSKHGTHSRGPAVVLTGRAYVDPDVWGADRHYNDRRDSDRGGIPELDGVELDSKAQEKLEELDPEDRKVLFEEFAAEDSRKPIQNPSGWVFGRARTKIIDRMTGRKQREAASENRKEAAKKHRTYQ